MPTIPLLDIPLKSTDEVDWITPLSSYISTHYSDDPATHKEELSLFNRMRQDIRGVGADLTGRDLLFRYYSQLDLLELRFPIDENHIKVSFGWYDAYTQKKISQFSLAYEKACVIFNLGSVISTLASIQPRTDPNSLKLCFHYYQLSAGVLTYINENFLHAPSSDLNREVIKVLVQLMLAQAQEVFYEKCKMEKKKRSLVAKVASMCEHMYKGVEDAMGEQLPKKVFGEIYKVFIKAKTNIYGSYAQYNKGKSCEEEAEYGEAVARFTLAEQLAKEAEVHCYALSRHLSPTQVMLFPADAGSSLSTISKRNHDRYLAKRDLAIKDNDMIYHHPVDNVEVLAPIEKLGAVKVIPFSELYSGSEGSKVVGQDVFNKIIPLSVHESASMYSEEMAKLVRSETERIEVADSELEASLMYLQLPESLRKFNPESAATLPDLTDPTDDLRLINSQIYQTEQESQPLHEMLAELVKQSHNIKFTLDEASKGLDMELKVGEGLRAQYQDLWSQVPSSSAAAHLRHDIKEYRELLDKASQSDATLMTKFNANKELLSILRSDPQNDMLSQRFAIDMATASTHTQHPIDPSLMDNQENLTESVKSIEILLSQLSQLKLERKDTLLDMKGKIQSDDITSVLVLNKKSSAIEPHIFATELDKYRTHQDQITKTIHHQQKLLVELTELYQSLMSQAQAKSINKGYSTLSQAKEQLISRMVKASDQFYELHSGAGSGVAFYKGIKPTVEELLNNVKRFADERADEREILKIELNSTRSDRQFEQLQAQLSKYEPNGGNRLAEGMQAMSLAPISYPGNTIPRTQPQPVPLTQPSYYRQPAPVSQLSYGAPINHTSLATLHQPSYGTPTNQGLPAPTRQPSYGTPANYAPPQQHYSSPYTSSPPPSNPTSYQPPASYQAPPTQQHYHNLPAQQYYSASPAQHQPPTSNYGGLNQYPVVSPSGYAHPTSFSSQGNVDLLSDQPIIPPPHQPYQPPQQQYQSQYQPQQTYQAPPQAQQHYQQSPYQSHQPSSYSDPNRPPLPPNPYQSHQPRY